MGTKGPIPNRSTDLSRDRDANRSGLPPITKGASRPAAIPEPDAGWHPIARLLWDAACSSGQADFYESSDYAYLYLICDELSDYRRATKRSSMMFAALDTAMGKLLLTEGDRRRVRIELQDETNDEDEAVAEQMSDYRNGLRIVS